MGDPLVVISLIVDQSVSQIAKTMRLSNYETSRLPPLNSELNTDHQHKLSKKWRNLGYNSHWKRPWNSNS